MFFELFFNFHFLLRIFYSLVCLLQRNFIVLYLLTGYVLTLRNQKNYQKRKGILLLSLFYRRYRLVSTILSILFLFEIYLRYFYFYFNRNTNTLIKTNASKLYITNNKWIIMANQYLCHITLTCAYIGQV